MTADEKIAEAEYNLTKLKRIISTKAPEFKFEISNFLSSANSILSHLLEEYGTKYGLVLPKIKYLSFVKEANRTKNAQAINFIDWENIEYKRIKNDQRFGFLIDKRNINIHHSSVGPTAFRAISKTFKAGNSQPIDLNLSKGLAYFSENQQQDVRTVCYLFLNSLRKMIQEAHSRFP